MTVLADEQAQLAELLARCAAQDRRALDELYRLAAPTVLACLMKILRRRALAEEALQDVFVSVWQKAEQFDQHRGRPYAWLVSMARYRAIDILRRERADATDPSILAETVANEPDAADSSELNARDADVLELCMGRLGDEQRESIRLAFLGGRSHPEVAAALQRPLGSVKSWIRRGLVALKECIESCSTRATN
jgi:RNA polymerase sigma-70 factor (ECF subfamily)